MHLKEKKEEKETMSSRRRVKHSVQGVQTFDWCPFGVCEKAEQAETSRRQREGETERSREIYSRWQP